MRSTKQIAPLILGAALIGCRATAQERSTGQFIDDAALTAKVKASIAEEDKVSPTSVNVTTYRGTMQLSGFVDNEEARQRAENAARACMNFSGPAAPLPGPGPRTRARRMPRG